MRNRLITLASLFVTFVVGGAFTYFVVIGPREVQVTDKVLGSNSNNGVVQCANEVTLNENSISGAVSKIYNAVVMIQNYNNKTSIGSGSGFVYKEDEKYGYIMTNNHVVANGNRIVVVLANDKEVEGEVLGSDPYIDLAVVRIKKENVLQVATIGSSESALLGDTVFTVGAPLGYEYRGSVTKGTLSGKNRMVSVTVNNSEDWVMSVLQVDAAINPGNSGGPLLNVNGEVIGINSLKLVQDEIEGMGFAIPIEDAIKYVSILEEGKTIERPLIGITMANVSNTYLLYQYGINLDSNIDQGVVIISIVDGSGANLAGLKKGDVITKLNNEDVKNAAYLKYELYKYNPGDTIDLTYIRDGVEKVAKVTLTVSK